MINFISLVFISLTNQLKILEYSFKVEKDLLPDEVLQDRRLARTLTSDDGDLGQVELHGDPERGEGILELVDDRDQRLHPRVPRHGPLGVYYRHQRGKK